MEDLNPTNPEPDATPISYHHSREMQRKIYEQVERPTEAELAELKAATGMMYHSREMQRESYEQSWGAEETLPLDESEEQSPPEGTEDANP